VTTSQRVVRDRKFCATCRQCSTSANSAPTLPFGPGLDSWCRSYHRAATREWRAGRTRPAAA
jgi:hypothetical protein